VDGERPMAFVVLSPDLHATADELIAYISGKRNKIFQTENVLFQLSFNFVKLIEKLWTRNNVGLESVSSTKFHETTGTHQVGVIIF
jgi:hypothetical protein